MTRATPRRGTRVVIIEDHELFAETLEIALTMEGYDVHRLPAPSASASPKLLLSTVARLEPRIVLLDLDLGAFGDASRLITPMAKQGANVVVVTATTDQARWGGCLFFGARRVISKSRPLNDILSTVRRLSQGLPVQDRVQREELLKIWHEEHQVQEQTRARLETLTNREREVLGRLMDGQTVRDIARSSVVSEATVRTQVKSILAKLQVSSQLAAVGLANHAGWLPPSRTR